LRDSRPLLLLVVVGSLLGLTANIVKLALQAGWPAIAFLCCSALGAGFVLLVLAAATGNRPGLGRQELAYYLWSGLLSIALPNALFFLAIPHVGAAFVALCLAFPPLATYLLALLFRMERPRAVRAAGVATGLVGALVLAFGRSGGGSAASFWAAMALAGPLVIAAGNIYRTLRWPEGASALSLAPGMLLGGAVLLVPFLLLPGSAPTFGQPLAVLLVMAQVAVFTATYALYFILQKIAGPVYLSQIGSVGAVVGASLAVLALGEPAGPALLLAGLLVLLGVFLVNRSRVT